MAALTKARSHKNALAKRVSSREVVETRPDAFKDGWNYRLMRVNCGACRSCSKGGYHHGPYWYACRAAMGVYRNGKYFKGKTRTVYIGKILRKVRDVRAEQHAKTGIDPNEPRFVMKPKTGSVPAIYQVIDTHARPPRVIGAYVDTYRAQAIVAAGNKGGLDAAEKLMLAKRRPLSRNS
ncbi:MAG: hypothetical protein SFW09_07945 [Hyphomicrobiaceae bacterium]|nr:hypothetical protein [Hyphomicrobiaceae bacterium]